MIETIFKYLDKHEIDYRLESNFCCGYIFYFLDGSIYPRRYHDSFLENNSEKIIAESVDHILQKVCSNELIKDWKHRIEAEDLNLLFNEVLKYLTDKGHQIDLNG